VKSQLGLSNESQTMRERFNPQLASPEGYRVVMTLEKYVRSSVEPQLLHLIKLRASILNGCSFCVDMHSADALAAGESARRLFAVAAWRESPFFTDEERAALALTDAVTQIAEAGVPDAVWEDARHHWSEKQLADLLMAIVAINAWNRIAITSHKQPPSLAQPDVVPTREARLQTG
jgi:AhpD family alkylhydroperoxidase